MIRTDLAIENREIYNSAKNVQDEIPGVDVQDEIKNNIQITRVIINTGEGAKALNKPIGKYITLEMPTNDQLTSEHEHNIAINIGSELKSMFDTTPKSLLVVGLGNPKITADSLGPNVVNKLDITRHILQFAPEEIDPNTTSVCAISPGVLGTTGMESSEIIKGIVEKVKPDAVIAVDALAARRVERINTTVQISNSGIHPGSGVGNRRKGLTKDELGVPVIAIGIPTVVDATTITNDIIERLLQDNISSEDKTKLITELTKDNNYVVTPKDIDDVIVNLSDIIAEGINIALFD